MEDGHAADLPESVQAIQKLTRLDIGYVVFSMILLLFVVAGWFEAQHLRAEVWLEHENAALMTAEGARASGGDASHPFVGCGHGPLSMVRSKSSRQSNDMATIVRILASREGCGQKWLTGRFVPTLGPDAPQPTS
jgi:hypothetical protein